MIRLVLDTNVLISAILNPQGKPALILRYALEGIFKSVTSQPLIKEVRRVLRYPKLIQLMKKNDLMPKEVETFLKNLERSALITRGELAFDIIQDDLSDNMVLAGAVEGEADFIISGDHHLLDLKTFEGIEILDPASFLKWISKTPKS